MPVQVPGTVYQSRSSVLLEGAGFARLHYLKPTVSDEARAHLRLRSKPGECPVVHRHDDLRLEVLVDLSTRIGGALRVGAAPGGNQDDVRVVHLLDEGHIAEEPSVAGMVEHA